MEKPKSSSSLTSDPQEQPKLDCEGFLADRDFGTPEIATILARANEIGELVLTDAHWAIISFVKEYYEEHGVGPPFVKVAKQTGLTMKQICGLFPCGLVKGAYRLAGLPRPPGCV
jgi:tRNA 2-thiouridine synthesizing protein E